MSDVLVLNQDYAVLAVARASRALALISRGKAEVLQHGVLPIQTSSCSIPRPSVIRLVYHVKRPQPKIRFTRQNVFKRDGHVCQYCGQRPKQLTLDHVMPVSRGGLDKWGNIVAACSRCNAKKSNRTPEEARMTLKRRPFEPKIDNYLHMVLGEDHRPEWQPFLWQAM